MFRLLISTAADARLAAAAAFLQQHPPSTEMLIVGASRGAADDLARALGRRLGATFGFSRFSLTQLAARMANARLAGSRRAPGGASGSEAIAVRAAFEAAAAGELSYFAPVAPMPGFPKALARTLHELRLAGLTSEQLIADDAGPHKVPPAEMGSRLKLGSGSESARSGPDLTRSGSARATAIADVGRLLARVEDQLEQAGVDDRAALFRLASDACETGDTRWTGLPLLLLDVTGDSRSELDFIGALARHAPDVLATAPDGDERVVRGLTALGAVVETASDTASPKSDLAHLRRYIFTSEPPPVRDRAGDVCLFSAPGEGREALEIVRRVLREAERGVPFDEMAVFLRTPQQYLGLLEHACARGGVPVYFDRGTRRPDPAGRAFVALLSCAVEGLSAKRFDEYLSLAQVPRVDQSPGRSTEPAVALPRDEIFVGRYDDGRARAPRYDGRADTLRYNANDGSAKAPRYDHANDGSAKAPRYDNANDGSARAPHSDSDSSSNSETDDPESAVPEAPIADSDDDAIVAGTLRSPWKWEELIVESAVVGGRTRQDGCARWRRRLNGLSADYTYRIAEMQRDEPESPRVTRFQRDLRNLSHLRAFALPIIDMLADWPERANWGDWLDRLSVLATQALDRPARVLQTLADLRPMAEVGPVGLEEARDVLCDRLVTLDWDPPSHRYGRLFIGTPHQARGRVFRVVFVPGLAERVVPQRPREDPLLLDGSRELLDAALMNQEQRGNAERLLLKIAIGAAGERLYLSYPRMDVAETRARVPSFYALDVMRAITGRVPDHRVLAAEAAEQTGATLAWPAPKNPDEAIDDLEHDLAVLKPLLDSRDPASVKGHAHYMLGLNEALRRSVISRWARGRSPWSGSDGIVKIAPGIQAAMDAQRLGERAYSLSALQRFATCPYQFLLATIHRLEPWEEPEPLLRMDPLTRGSLFHEVQAELLRALKDRHALPVTQATVPEAARLLDTVLARVAAEYAERLAPAIDRVWRDEIAELGRDLAIWVRKLADEAVWVPEYFEFSFGLNDEGRDPRSVRDAVVVGGRFRLHGSVDLIEHRSDQDVLRVTDHKTGKNRSKPELIVGGGTVLQPVLYSVVVEQALQKKVSEGRLFYCTTAGGFADHKIPLDDYRRAQGLEVLTIVDRAIERGFLVAAPADGACRWCDFHAVCGPREEERIGRKNQKDLADLHALRSMR